jgi:hypothetical protein
VVFRPALKTTIVTLGGAALVIAPLGLSFDLDLTRRQQ